MVHTSGQHRVATWTTGAVKRPELGFSAGIMGALQRRREIVEGLKMTGPEITLAVENIAETILAIKSCGGRLLSQPFRIQGVGELIWFADPEGNVLGAMQYEPGL